MLEHDRWRSPSAEALARSCEGEIEDPWFYDYESMVRRTYNLTARLAANSEAMASAPEGVDICRLVAIARLSEGDELLLDYGRCASRPRIVHLVDHERWRVIATDFDDLCAQLWPASPPAPADAVVRGVVPVRHRVNGLLLPPMLSWCLQTGGWRAHPGRTRLELLHPYQMDLARWQLIELESAARAADCAPYYPDLDFDLALPFAQIASCQFVLDYQHSADNPCVVSIDRVFESTTLDASDFAQWYGRQWPSMVETAKRCAAVVARSSRLIDDA